MFQSVFLILNIFKMKIKIQFDAISEIENCVSKIDSITDNARSDWDKLD